MHGERQYREQYKYTEHTICTAKHTKQDNERKKNELIKK
jgi:hypothetical protein